MPNWLWRSVVGISATIAFVTVMQWGSCRFYVLPTVWPSYAKYIGTNQNEQMDLALMGCAESDTRTTTILMGLLTTLISLSRNAE